MPGQLGYRPGGTGNVIDAPYVVQGANLLGAILNPVWNQNLGDLAKTEALQYVCDGNLLNTLDRRITLEVGCSLPIKNSPLVDHGVEAPDFVLGRYMFHQPYSMSNSVQHPPIPEITVPGSARFRCRVPATVSCSTT